MFNTQMSPQLPFAVNQLQFPVGNYNTVPNIGLEPHLQSLAGIIPNVSQCLISEIQNYANQSPLRTFLFNQMASNGFQNSDFAAIVKGTIEYFAYLIRRGMGVDHQQVLLKACQDMVIFITANNTRRFPQLQQLEDNNKLMVVLQNFDMVTQDIQRERMQNQYPGVQQQMNGGHFQQFNMTPNFQQATGNQAPARNYGVGNGSIFTSGEPVRMVDNSNNSGLGRNYGGLNNNAAQASEQIVQNEILQHVEQTDSSVNLTEADENWKPSEGNFYRPAYEPSHQKLVATLKGGRYFYQVRELEGNEMDPSRHRLTPLFGNNNSLITEKLKGSVEDTSKVLADAVSDAKSAPTKQDLVFDSFSRIRLDNEMPIELGYDSIWISGIVERINRVRGRNDNAPIHIMQWDAKVAKAFVIDNADEANAIRRLSRMDSSQLLMAIANVKDKFSPSVLNIIDERLTQAINTAIKTNLSISGLSIDSFIDDWNSLINHISNKYGEMIAAKFVAKDEEIIRCALNILDDSCAKNVTSGIYDTLDGENYPIAYFAESVSFTMLEFFSSELDLDFNTDTSALLSKVNTRVWYDLADQIFREYGDICTRHLIRTVDGKILEIKKGWLTDNAYIVNLVG